MTSQKQFVSWVHDVFGCAHDPTNTSVACDARIVLATLRDYVLDLLRTDVVFASDVPYTLFVPEIVEAVGKENLYSFWSRRHPMIWATKRVQEHSNENGTAYDIICKPDIVRQYNLPSALDLVECLTAANSTPANPVYVGQVVEPISNLSRDLLAAYLARHIRFLGALLDPRHTRTNCVWDDDDDNLGDDPDSSHRDAILQVLRARRR